MDKAGEWKIQFLRKKKIAKNVYSLYFKKPDGFSYKAGQYLNLHLTLFNGKKDIYSFTLSSAPFERELEITTLMSNSPFKRKLFSLAEGEEVFVRGPFGEFSLSDENKTKVMIAGGIGITPFRSMIAQHVFEKYMSKIVLFAFFRDKEAMAFRGELEQYSEKHTHLRIVFSQTGEASDWNGEKGRITKELIGKYCTIKDSIFYLAGSSEMVDSTADLLGSMGVSHTDIKTDIFVGIA